MVRSKGLVCERALPSRFKKHTVTGQATVDPVESGLGLRFCSNKKCDALLLACLSVILAQLDIFKRSKNQLSGQ